MNGLDLRITDLLAQKARREGRKKIPKAEISDAIGISRAMVSRWERNEVNQYPKDTLRLWCEFLEVEPGELFKEYVPLEIAPAEAQRHN